MKGIVFGILFGSILLAQETFPDFKCGRSGRMLPDETSRIVTTVEQDKIDVTYYGIHITIDPENESIEGYIDIIGNVLDSTLSQFQYDLANTMAVDSVFVEGVLTTHSHILSQVRFSADSSLTVGDEFHHTIYYNGNPVPTGFGSFVFAEEYGRKLIATLSEPYGARSWWPCKDAPQDKADSVDIYVTVPSEYIVASNGVLVGVDTEAPASQRWHWHESYPITTYLVSLAIYPYYTWEETYVSPLSGETLPLNYYVFPEDSADAHEDFNIMNASMGVFAEMFGEYPFMGEKYGMAAFSWGGAMEHQTCTSYNHDLITGTHAYDFILIHELAHQWWGDLVTCYDFHHIWINEGFATYSEALWHEEYYDEETFWSYMDSRLGFQDWWANPAVYRYDAESAGEIFHTTVYKKGAWVLHMLRGIVGDEDFFEILRTYGASPNFAYKTATTEEFRDHCELITDMDLDTFFQQWIYESHYPEYDVYFTNQTHSVDITIGQTTQTGVLFTMPVDLDIVCPDTTIRTTVTVSGASEVFTVGLPVDQSVQQVVLDPDNWVLNKVEYLNTNPAYILPDEFSLDRIYPNPFNNSTTITFSLPVQELVRIRIYSLLGDEIWSEDQQVTPGNHHITWDGTTMDGSSVSSGVYFVQVSMNQFSETRKILLLK